jgi:hypothetical protein
MKKALALIAAATLGASTFSVLAQDTTGAVAVSEIEAIVTVIDVDADARIVTVQGPRGRTATIDVPPEAQNLDQVHPGAKFKMRYIESVALALTRGGNAAPSASAGKSVQLAAKGDTPGGMIVTVKTISAEVEGVDNAGRILTVRGPQGNVREFKVSDDVQGLDEVNVGDLITLQYTEALAMRMIKE